MPGDLGSCDLHRDVPVHVAAPRGAAEQLLHVTHQLAQVRHGAASGPRPPHSAEQVLERRAGEGVGFSFVVAVRGVVRFVGHGPNVPVVFYAAVVPDSALTLPLVRLVDIRELALSSDEVHAALVDPAAGGVTVFVGAVRNHDADQGVIGLSYSAHPSALRRLREVVAQVGSRHDVIGLAAVHRVGDLDVGDAAVIVGASAAHRGQAFEACRDLIDDLKASVPIWKHQRFADGSDEWVGTP